MQSPEKEPRILHHDASAATLVFMLKFVFLVWLVRYSIDPLQQLSQLPIEYTNPVGWLNLLPVGIYKIIHSYGGLLLLKGLILACCIGVWNRRWRLPAAVSGCLLITSAAAISRGFGHLNHAELGPLLVTWVLTIFALRMPVELIRRPDHQPHATASTGLVTAAVVLSLVYALVGIARLCYGGIDAMAGETIENRVVAMSFHDWLLDYNFSQWVLANPVVLVLLKLGTAIVTVLEIATPFCLVSRRVRMAVLVIMPAFHLGAMVLFKVVFIEQPLMLILFVNLTPWLANQPPWGRFGSIGVPRHWRLLARRPAKCATTSRHAPRS